MSRDGPCHTIRSPSPHAKRSILQSLSRSHNRQQQQLNVSGQLGIKVILLVCLVEYSVTAAKRRRKIEWWMMWCDDWVLVNSIVMDSTQRADGFIERLNELVRTSLGWTVCEGSMEMKSRTIFLLNVKRSQGKGSSCLKVFKLNSHYLSFL